MIRNNIELKKGDYICAYAIDYGGYHYLEAFAFKINEINNGTIQCIFHGSWCDDFVFHYHSEPKTIQNLHDMQGYDICVVSKYAFEEYIKNLNQKDLDEFDIWNYFEPIFKTSIAKIVEYTQEDFI